MNNIRNSVTKKSLDLKWFVINTIITHSVYQQQVDNIISYLAIALYELRSLLDSMNL